ncbi:radical SAM protein [Rhodopseudomonas palustris]|uniref:radical SAM protein n=1 Tax=Rhodopseudomonas palustris TaxID=1076 RepID=UPI000AD4DCCB|nr:radical SAM protein [Rhodopseudomonas palustris]
MIADHLYSSILISDNLIDRYREQLAHSTDGTHLPLGRKSPQNKFLTNKDFVRNPLMTSRLLGHSDELLAVHDRYLQRLIDTGALRRNRSVDAQILATEFVACVVDFMTSTAIAQDFDQYRKVRVIVENDDDPEFSVGQLLLYFICSVHGMAAGFRLIDQLATNEHFRADLHHNENRTSALLHLWRGFLHLVAGREIKALSSFRSAKHLCNINLIAQLYCDELAKRIEQRSDSHLIGRFCSYPFSKLYTNQSGETHHCCLAFSPLRAGSIDDPTFDWNSRSSIEFRRSILNGEFTYCDKTSCAFIVGGSLPTREQAAAEDPRLAQIIEHKLVEIEPSGLELVFEHDASCNLACPSCRSSLIAHPKIATEQLDERFPYLLELLNKSIRLSVSGYGDPFFSRHYRQLLKLINKANAPNLTIDLITNAVLLTPQTWEGYAHLHSMFGSISVSVDAARGETYAKVRKLGDFDKLMSNLKFISELRQRGVFSTFLIQCVVQADNFREMEDFVELGLRLAVDGVIFQRLFPYGIYTDPTQFEKADVFSPSHPEHLDFLTILRSDRLKKKGVSCSTFQDLYDRLNPIDYYFDSLNNDGSGIAAFGWAFIKSGHQTGKVSIILKRDGHKKRYCFGTDLIHRPDVAAALSRHALTACGFSLKTDGQRLPPGRYQIGIRIDSPNTSVTEFTNRFVDVSPQSRESIKYSIDILQGGHDVTIHGWAYLSGGIVPDQIFVIFKSLSSKRCISFEARSISRPDVGEALGRDLAKCGFSFSLDGRSLPSGDYEIGFRLVKGKTRASRYSGRTVSFAGYSTMVA